MSTVRPGGLHLITFGDNRFAPGRQRLRRQAAAFGDVFKTIRLFGEEDLGCEFWNKYAGKMMGVRPGRPGRCYAYYACKTYFVSQSLRSIPEGDILLYVDAGCELNPRGRQMLIRYLHACSEGHGLFSGLECDEAEYTKMDSYRRVMGIDDSLLITKQLASVAFFLRNGKTARNLADQWCRIAVEADGRFLDDSPSVLENHSSFKEHRHDQSILSLLVKSIGRSYQFAICADHTYGDIWRQSDRPPERLDVNQLIEGWNRFGSLFPIWATRTGQYENGFWCPLAGDDNG